MMERVSTTDPPVPPISSAVGAMPGPAKEPPTDVAAESARAVVSAEASKGSRSEPAPRRMPGIRDSSGDRLDVSVDPKDGLVIRVVDGSGNVIRQIPPDELVALARKMDEMIGLLFDRKA